MPFRKNSTSNTTVSGAFRNDPGSFSRPTSVEELQTELRGMAASLSQTDPRAAERLADLGDSLMIDSGRLHWADVDLRSAFISETLANGYALRREGGYVPARVDRADKLRNVLVLLPIMLTWAALAEATRNYQKYIDINPEAIRKPFLLLWQEGFGGMAKWWQPNFATVAIMDALIIAIIILLTFYSHGVREAQEEQVQKTANLFRAELDNVLAEATVELAPDRAGRPATLARAVDRLADRFDLASQELLTRIQAEHKRLDAISGQRERELGDFSLFATSMRSGAEETMRMVTELRNLSTDLRMSVDDMTSEVGLAVDQQKSLLNAVASLERLTTASAQSDGSLTRQLSDAAVVLAESADRAIAGADSSAQAGRTAAEAVHSIASLASNLAINQSRLEEAITGQSQSNMQLADSLRSGFSGTSATAKSLGDISQSLMLLRDDFHQMSELSQEHSITLARLLTEETGVTNTLSEVARDISAIGLATNQRHRELSEEVSILVRRLDALSSTLGQIATAWITPENDPVEWPATRDPSAQSAGRSWPQRD